jgi:TonB family protein
MLRARFYEAWVQPEGVTAPRGRIVVPVDVQIDERGRVVRFKIATSSGLRALDESIAAIRGQVKKVDPPPMSLPNGRFDLRINFELDVKR